MSKVIKKSVSQTLTSSVTITSFANKFLDRRENAAIAIDLQKMKVENEHLADVLIGVNAQLRVQNDLVSDVEQHSSMFKNSEAKRDGLRQDIAKHAATHKSNEAAW
jgi:hypothetical protein